MLWRTILFGGSSALALLACHAPTPLGDSSAPDSRPPRESPRALLRVGTSGDYAPFSLRGEGFDVEVARAFAADRGYALEWVAFRWPELAADFAAGRFDVAMSGVTWRPERAVRGYMTRAVAAGGPCVLGDPDGPRIAVNRGGALERWARRALADRELVTVDRNLDLPQLLARAEVDAIVTDRFERPSFEAELAQRGRPAPGARCEPPIERKVYWISPAAPEGLAAELDAWIESQEARIDGLRERWLGASAPRTAEHHLADLVARRLALMPAVAAWKRARGRPIEDPAREDVVLESVVRRAVLLGLPAGATRALFRLQIELAKRIQRESRAPESLDLEALRPLILALGERQLEALAALPTAAGPELGPAWDPVDAWLLPEERARLIEAVGRVGRVEAGRSPPAEVSSPLGAP